MQEGRAEAKQRGVLHAPGIRASLPGPQRSSAEQRNLDIARLAS